MFWASLPGAPVLEAGQAYRACTGLEGWLLSPTEVNGPQQAKREGVVMAQCGKLPVSSRMEAGETAQPGAGWCV